VGTADWKNATEANFDAALATMRTELLKNEGKEKALIFVEGHGASLRETRVQKLKDGDPPIPGEGFTFDLLHNSLSLTLDVDDQQRLQEEASNGLGGLLFDADGLSRITQPVLNWTTYAQSLTGAIGVYVNDVFAGSLTSTGPRDDFVLPLADTFLSQIQWSNSAPIDWNIRFDFASSADWFQLATEYDYFQDPTFSAEFDHYGLGVSNILYQGEGVPEPSTLVLAALGIMLATSHRRRGVRIIRRVH
jgi:hypothetical protein